MTEKNAQTATGSSQQPSTGTAEKPSINMAEREKTRKDSVAKDSTQTSPASKPENGAAGTRTSPKKRRKVNHAYDLRLDHLTYE
ncbi:hypothetical protein EYZ11_011076 [Aspergillus tanneri]|uniref:Uncharacterized protein n=1 Tax=Aspergillus tanneri TaxID=1220188 RepID=A0A4S3J419_9EURO|nr:hypothetical protein EYZ11_011076 [Aspergillus tanneri]